MNKVAIAAMTALAIVAAGTQTAAAKADGMEPAQGATRDSRQTGAPDGGSGMKARKMSEEQREAMLLRTGGMIETPESGPWIAAVLEKGAVPDEMAEAEIAYLRKTVKVPVRVIEAEEGAAADRQLNLPRDDEAEFLAFMRHIGLLRALLVQVEQNRFHRVLLRGGDEPSRYAVTVILGKIILFMRLR